MITREVNGVTFRKSTFSGAGDDCVYLAATGDAVYDSKSDRTLPGAPRVTALVARVRAER